MGKSVLEAIMKRSLCLLPSFIVPRLHFLSFPGE